mmetsp:Transcript_2769/g.9347  ORF Transcript_2769/g.9347 Transcript_2769/m.9347 type:complete len:207 (-) Transcript_2769:1312-1932(-)
MFSAGTRTLSKASSQWPWGASSKPSALSGRTTVSPGVPMGTSTMEWRACRGWPSVSSSTARPMKMQILQSGLPAPVIHHLRPLSTSSSPSMRTVACMLVASDEATSGSVIAKQERISPASRGSSHRAFCSAVPNMCKTSMLPVSGALQLKSSGAQRQRPISSASVAYSRFVSPDSSGRKRFHRPARLASALSASSCGADVQRSGES